MSRGWTERLQYLSNLEDGWLDGYGKPSRPEAMQATENLLAGLFPTDEDYNTKRPGIFPQQDGGITIEWYVGGQLISIEVMGDDYDETYAFFEMECDGKKWFAFDSDSLADTIARIRKTVLFADVAFPEGEK